MMRRGQVGATLRRMGRDARRWGLPGALGGLLLATALLLVGLLVPRERDALLSDQRALREARLHAAQLKREQRADAQPQDPARRFIEAFPNADERHRRISNLLGLAAGLGLQPRHSEVRSAAEPALGLTRLRVVLPLRGSYETLRRYVDQALRDDPALALDLLRLERADPDAAEVRAELQWSLWMQSDATVPPGDPRMARADGARGAAR
jgi:hypothetical protein